MMFFLKDIKRYLFFSSHQPMQRYAGNGRDTRPKWPLKWPLKWPPVKYGFFKGHFFISFF